MKFNLLVLTALAGCAFAGVISDVESRDVTPDLDLVGRDDHNFGIESLKPRNDNEFVGRDGLDVDIETRDDSDLVSRDNLETREPQPPLQNQCPPRWQSIPFFRRGSFPLSTTPIVGFFFLTKRFSTAALWVSFNPRSNDYLFTISEREASNAIRNLGYRNQGIAGYVFTNNRCGGAPLFRMFNSARRQHFYTVTASERRAARRLGWVDEGVTGFIFRNIIGPFD